MAEAINLIFSMELKDIKKIGIIALAGDCDSDKILKSKEYFNSASVDVVLSENIFDKNRYLAGRDEDKIRNLHKFFEDDSIKLILNARGGFGSLRLINKIDYDLIKKHPKPFCGYSDITVLLLMIYKKTGMVVYHSPMASSDFADEINDYTLTNFLKVLGGETLEIKGTNVYQAGIAKGILWGGNLSSVVSLCGMDFIPDEEFIFFTEDLNEPAYKIEKMFTQLFNIDKFKQNCRGIVLGEFLNIDNKNWFEEFIQELANKINIPISGGFKITHGNEKVTIPIGRNALMKNEVLKVL